MFHFGWFCRLKVKGMRRALVLRGASLSIIQPMVKAYTIEARHRLTFPAAGDDKSRAVVSGWAVEALFTGFKGAFKRSV